MPRRKPEGEENETVMPTNVFSFETGPENVKTWVEALKRDGVHITGKPDLSVFTVAGDGMKALCKFNGTDVLTVEIERKPFWMALNSLSTAIEMSINESATTE